jgi:hypothetical protein
MSKSVRSQKKFDESARKEIVRKIWAQVFGIFIRKAREESLLPLAAIASLACMRVPEWLAMEAGDVPDPAELNYIAAVLGLSPEKRAVAARLCSGAWKD